MNRKPLYLYIQHEDLQTPENGIAYFGPFDEDEIHIRLHDAFAETLADTGDVDAVLLKPDQAKKLCVNSRDWWLKQVDEIEEFGA